MVIREHAFIDVETTRGPMRTHVFEPKLEGRWPGVIFYSEIYQMTAPIERLAMWLAGHGYLVAVPEVYHELEPAGTILAYDTAGTEKGNTDKYEKELASYDDDARALVAALRQHPRSTGAVGRRAYVIASVLAAGRTPTARANTASSSASRPSDVPQKHRARSAKAKSVQAPSGRFTSTLCVSEFSGLRPWPFRLNRAHRGERRVR